MPVTPPVAPQPYDYAYSILNAARVRLGQTKLPSLYPHSGNILDATQAGTQQAFNSALRKFQDELCNNGFKRFESEIIIVGIPIVTNMDPASQCSISWFNCFDGSNYETTPVLPSNLLFPIWMSERPTGMNSNFPWPSRPNMPFMIDGLPMHGKTPNNGCAEWRGDAIYYPGATFSVDFRIRYRGYLPDLADVGQQRWFQLPVQIMRCQDPLSAWICREFAFSRAADPEEQKKAEWMALAAAFESEARMGTKLLINRDVSQNSRLNSRRQPYGNGGGSLRRR